MFVFGLSVFLGVMTGLLDRFGIDPWSFLRTSDMDVVTVDGATCEAIDFSGVCVLDSETRLTRRGPNGQPLIRGRYRLEGGPRRARAVMESESRPPERVRCEGVWLDGPCEQPEFDFYPELEVPE